ncbi:sensor histidine kinase [Streptomyces marincola]|uniref:sensor histidine kinase n=1 Tax=Streptomyces marincola TaxID=2878388 RepID=UPI001CF2DC43|nr:ATP-binding protein [Streptomyces marincola]UCM89395.1 ATP-binding protein [Streptomyces marincola]
MTTPTVSAARGPAEREFTAFAHRFALYGRTVVLALCSVLAVLAMPADDMPVTAAVCLAVLAWCCVRLSPAAALRPRAATVCDLAVMAGMCLSRPLVVPESQTAYDGTWIVVAISFLAVSYQLTHPPLTGAFAAVLLGAADLAGAALADPDGWTRAVPVVGWVLMEAALARVLFVVVLRESRAADAALRAAAAARRDLEVAEARRAAEREHLAVLHDTASATLLMASLPGSGVRPGALRAQAARDLDRLLAARDGVAPDATDGSGEASGPEEADVAAELTAELAAHPVLDITAAFADDLGGAPRAAVTSLRDSVGEALRNVVRHAGVTAARVAAERSRGVLTVTVSDLGAGFDPADVPAHRQGLKLSVAGRMAAAGGSADIASRPGEGTTVRLTWPDEAAGARAGDAAEGGGDRAAGRFPAVERHLFRGLRHAGLVILAVIHFALALPSLLGSLPGYSHPPLQVAAFCVLTGVLLVTAAYLLRGRPWPARWPAPALGAVLAASVAATSQLPADDFLRTPHWSFLEAGWFGVVLLGHRGFQAVGAFIAGHLALMIGLLYAAGAPSRPDAAGMALSALAVCGFQVAVVLGLGLLRDRTDAIAAAARDRESLRIRATAALHIHADQRERYRALQATVLPLLGALARGTADPEDPAVRRACAREATRLRRLFAESDYAGDQLIHELRACIDVAERAGVTVSLAVRGEPLHLPQEVRRALTDPVIAALAAARHTARATVVRAPGQVRVGVVIDVPDAPALPAARAEHDAPDGVRVRRVSGDGRLFVEAACAA